MYPLQTLCIKCGKTETERKKRRGNQLPHKCYRCKIRFNESSMACKNVCQECWLQVTGIPWEDKNMHALYADQPQP